MGRPPQPRCPVRPGEPCTLCHTEATGPADCGLVYLVMHDPDLRAGLADMRGRRSPARLGDHGGRG